MNDIANKKTLIILWVLCILGSLSSLPYLQYLGIAPFGISIWKIALLSAIDAVLFFGLCWLSFKILPKTDLHPFPTLIGKQYITRIVYPALISGALIGLVIFVYAKLFFRSSLLSGDYAPFWASGLSSIHGAINGEVFLRLFLLTLIYFFVVKFLKIQESNKVFLLWCVNISVALFFGLGNLPTVFKLAVPSAFEKFQILILNGIAGAAFGWLYWSRGLWAAIGAHFVTDLIIHGFL